MKKGITYRHCLGFKSPFEKTVDETTLHLELFSVQYSNKKSYKFFSIDLLNFYWSVLVTKKVVEEGTRK